MTNMKPILWVSVCLLLLTLSACSQYGKVSDQTYGYAQSLYTICSARNSERLEALLQQIEADENLIEREKSFVKSIAVLAENGEWEQAAIQARRLMEEQVGD